MVHNVKLNVFPAVKGSRVSKYLYSQFIEHIGRCVYPGIWVGKNSRIDNYEGIRKDVVSALKKLKIPVIRWPGGCFADTYHWMDGVGVPEKRPARYNHWWNQPENNAFGTDEFMKFCGLIESKPYLACNLATGSIKESCDWVEYCNSTQKTEITRMRIENGHEEPYNVQFWGIGNENWGCGGNFVPEYYADNYRRFATFIRKTLGEQGRLIACGANVDDLEWNERVLAAMRKRTRLMDYLSIHVYHRRYFWKVQPERGNCNDLDFTEQDYYNMIASVGWMEEFIQSSIGLVTAYSHYGHQIGIILDEWGTWYKNAVNENGMYQQNTLMDAIYTAASFHTFHHCGEKLFMTNMAQAINVLQALILTKGDRMVTTPTYHIFEMFMPHRDNTNIATVVDNNPELILPHGKSTEMLSISSTFNESRGELHVSVVNQSLDTNIEADIDICDGKKWVIVNMRRLTSDDIHDHNTFDEPEKVFPMDLGVDNPVLNRVSFPSKSVTTITFKCTKK